MKKAFTILAIGTIIIGVLALAFNTAFGYETITYLYKVRITTGGANFYIWKFDYWGYLRNLQLSASDVSILQFNVPTRQWNSDVINDLQVILDYIILTINIMLYPLKLGSYITINLLAILGINTDTTATHNGLAWLTIFFRDLIPAITIPYI